MPRAELQAGFVFSQSMLVDESRPTPRQPVAGYGVGLTSASEPRSTAPPTASLPMQALLRPCAASAQQTVTPAHRHPSIPAPCAMLKTAATMTSLGDAAVAFAARLPGGAGLI